MKLKKIGGALGVRPVAPPCAFLRTYPPPPRDAEYAEPPEGTEAGFFSCKTCVYVREEGTVCIFKRWSMPPPFSVTPAGCCRFQYNPKIVCETGSAEATL